MTPDVSTAIKTATLRLRSRAPFFATLVMYAQFVPRDDLPTAATDGRDVFYNPEFFETLESHHLDAVIVHEVLHAALGHVHRRGARDAQRWNQAADIVVNGLIIAAGLSLPPGHLRDTQLERFSAEEIYAILTREQRELEPVEIDLYAPGDGLAGDTGSRTDDGPPSAESRRRADARHWAAAVDRAIAVARMQGKVPAGIERAFELDDRPNLDWRSVLWRYLSRTPTDFAEYDRRHIHRGLYVETLESVSLRIVIAIDTSGSIDADALSAFSSELFGILRAYAGTEAWLFYADAEAYGPYLLDRDRELPPAQGGGGTDFRPVFAAVDEHGMADERTVAVYLTDGHGDFPDTAPGYPVLWVVTAGGLDDDRFPFGDVVRLVDTGA